jgi:2-dehydro-3-deoxyphosphogluconate aldolase / (4S)-4-hydroxy-2-oxoglutarate aldolase
MTIRTIFAKGRVVPVLTIDDAEAGADLAKALVAGGMPVLEITLRTRGALAAVEKIRAAVSGAVVGVGTVIRLQDVRSAVDAGVQFAVSPGLSEELAKAASDAKLPYMPAVQTGSEIMAARRLGFTTLKFFPARSSGGIAALKAFAPVFQDVAFCPTGGVSGDDFRDYLKRDNVVAVGGSWMVPGDRVKARDWRGIEALARRTMSALV